MMGATCWLKVTVWGRLKLFLVPQELIIRRNRVDLPQPLLARRGAHNFAAFLKRSGVLIPGMSC